MSNTFYDSKMAKQQERLAATKDMRQQRQVLLDALAPRAGESVLELGCGNGVLARDLSGLVGSSGMVVGVDNSEAIISLAEHLCPGADFRTADVMDLPFNDSVFDAVVAAQLLCFVPDVPRSLREARRVLKSSGRLVLLDTDWDSLVWNTREPELMRRVMEVYTSFYEDRHVPRTLSRRLGEAGFRIMNRFSFTVLNWSNDESGYAGQTAGFVIPIMEKSDAFTQSDIERWSVDQDELVAGGEYLFSLNRYVFVADKI